MPEPDFPQDTLPFAAPQLATLLLTLQRFDARSRELGERYHSEDRVLELFVDEPCVQAEVLGSQRYSVIWEPGTGATWHSECSCPVGSNCKHAYAAALYLVDRCAPAVVAEARHMATPAKARSKTPRSSAAKSKHPSAEDLFGRRVDLWHRRETLRRMLARPQFRYLSAYDPVFEDLLTEPDPDVLAWRLANQIVISADGDVPPELTPYLERPDLVERFAERRRSDLRRELMRWISQKRQPAKRSLRFVWSLQNTTAAGPRLRVDARLSSPRIHDESRNLLQLRQLRAESISAAGGLAAEHSALLGLFVDGVERQSLPTWSSSQVIQPALALALLRVGNDSGAMVWGEDLDPALGAAFGIAPGQPLRFETQQVRLLPAAIAHDDGARLELHCFWPDGREKRLQEVLFFSDNAGRTPTSLVLADGAFAAVTEQPPGELMLRFADAGSLDVARDQCATVLAPLAEHFDHVRQTLSSRTRVVPTKPVIALDLPSDDWMQIRVFARGGDAPWQPPQTPGPGTTIFEYSPEEHWLRWSPPEESTVDPDGYGIMEASIAIPSDDPVEDLSEDERAAYGSDDTPVTPAAECWIESPDPGSTMPALAWLAAIDATPAPQDRLGRITTRKEGWWLQTTAKRMAVFAELWDERPPEAEFVGTARVRRLLSNTSRVRAKVQVTSSGLDWFSVAAEWEAEGLRLTDSDLAKLRASSERFVRLPSGWVQRDVADNQDDTAEVFADLGIEFDAGEQRITMWQLVGARPESVAELERLGLGPDAAEALKRMQRQLKQFKGVPAVPLPKAISAELRPYQKQGLDFLAYTSSLGIGAVLADDMGLGKTLQALAWLEHLRTIDPDSGPALVVCPTSVMHNWEREAARFAPGLRVLLLERGAQRHELRKELNEFDLVITNYSLLRRDIEDWKEVELRAAILDEAQNIKNPDAVVSKAAFELRAKHRLALTGTPLENRPLDLWSIMNFVNPGYLGSRSQFSMRFDRVDAPPHCRTLLGAKLRPVLLRRMKREVATDLPDRIEERRDCELTEGQRLLYLAELRRSQQLIDDLSEAPGGIRQNKIAILAALTRLRQICCHPALAGGKASLGSGKFDALFELLEPLLAEGHKVLLFSQFVQCLELIEKEFVERDIAHHKLTGQTTRRKEVVQKFQEDENASVFLISLKAGGTGLNLTAASYVILFDPWWNPAVEAQAIDRTHRIGQDQTVIAYRMLTRGTIEEKIFELQQRKSALVRDILGEDGFARALNRDDLDFLLQEV